MKETISVLKALKGMNEMDTSEIQVYITDEDGFIIELKIGIDEDGEICKSFDAFDSFEELEESHQEEIEEVSEPTLLN